MEELNLENLLAVGAHFGHQTYRWNPKMKKYIYGERNGVYIIDLAQTLDLAQKAYDFIKQTAASGKSVLFVGTKRQAAPIVKAAAEKCGAFHITNRWLGGMLTNYKTVSQSIDKIRKVDRMKENGDFFLLTKKEQIKVEKDISKLEKNLGGIKNMRKLPGAIFIIDPSCEHIAVREAMNLNIPIVSIADTNCDPSGIDYIVPANDDAYRSINFFVDYFAQAVIEGSRIGGHNSRSDEDGRDVALEKEILAKYEKDIDLLNNEEQEEEKKEVEQVSSES